MSDDIVTRLRADWFRPSRSVQDEAAAEIERLRAAGDRLADGANHAAGCARWDWSGPCDCGLDGALTGWREARRG